jgi:VWFA-related protein
VLEDGVPQPIGHFSDADSALELVLALDFSTSMTNFVDELRTAVLRFLAALPAKAQVTMLAFNDDMFTLARPSDSLEEGMRAFNEMTPAGGTAMHDVILRSLGDLSRGLGRRTLVVFTDGEDRTSRASAAQVRRAIESSDVTVYFVALGRGREAKELQEGMAALSDVSGGRTLRAATPGELEQRFKEVVEELAHQYLLGYDPTNPNLDGTWRKIEVKVNRERLRVRARPGYRAEPPPK